MRHIALAAIICFMMGALVVEHAGAARRTVEGGAPRNALADALDAATDGDTIRVMGGRFDGQLRIERSVVLLGEEWPVIDGNGLGTVVEVIARDVTIRGFLICNSGTLLEAEHAGVTVKADRTAIVGNRIENVLFGVYAREADSCVVRNNHIIGYRHLKEARRGDLVRAWYSRHARIEDNVLESGRDLIVWFSDNSVVRGNLVSYARYGVHLMYDRDCEVENNTFIHNSVGAYLMYSRNITLKGNTMAYNRGPSGFGVGLKDLDDSKLLENSIVDNRVGVFVDNSPREITSYMLFEHNVIAFNDQGILMPASVERTEVSENSFMDNYEDVAVPGGGRVPRVTWSGNYWSDYAGYDGDGDGLGDVPYQSDKLFEDLVNRYPKLRFFVYSPAIQALSLAAKAFPVVRPQPKLVDDKPRLHPYFPSEPPVIEKASAWPLGVVSFVMIGMGVLLAARAGFGAARRWDRGDEI